MGVITMIATYNTAVTEAASEILGKEHRRKKPWVTRDFLDLCVERRDLKKKQYEAEGANEYREATKRIQKAVKKLKEDWIGTQYKELETYLNENNSKRANQLVKDLASEKQGLPVCTAITQNQLDTLAQTLVIQAEVTDNLKNGLDSHNVKISLQNTGSDLVPSAGWELFFHSAYMLFPSEFPKTLSTILEKERVKVTMHGGDLYSLQPASGFKEIAQNETRMIYIVVAYWSVSETDFMPKWYLTSDEAGVEPRVIQSTDSEMLDFVAPFDEPRQWKRYRFDRYNPFTSQERYNRYYVRDTQIAEQIIIPTPMTMTVGELTATMTVDNTWQIFQSSMETDKVAQYLKAELQINITANAGSKTIDLNIDESVAESYVLDVKPDTNMIAINGSDVNGVFYGVQSLLSLLATYPGGLPEIHIKDKPRFEHRGMHVDVARNFRSVDDIKRLLDAMAMYKLNKLHLHLTDDEGWRLEIPGLPELIEVGANRCHDPQERQCVIPQWGSGPDKMSSGTGFFSVDDYKELLRYADDLFIEVNPEFDMPGHAHAVIAAMEERYRTLSGINMTEAEEFRLIDPDDSSFYISVQQWMDNAVNPCIESTYRFINKIMDAVVEMHKDIQPLTTYHFGGDEVSNGAWENSSACINLSANNPQYDSPKGLKKYFAERVATLAAEKGLRLRGWEDGVFDANGEPFPIDSMNNPNMIADAWNNIWEWGGAKRAYKLANAGYKVIMAQGTALYFDQPYEPDPKERGLYWASRFTDTRKVFSFLPDSLYDNSDAERSGKPLTKTDICGVDFSKCDALEKRENIIGMQGHLWSETVRTRENFDYMIFPRLLALAERAWYKADFEEEGISMRERDFREKKAWEAFANALGHKELKRLDDLGIQYRIPPPGATVSDNMVQFAVTFPGLTVEYSENSGQSWSEIAPDASIPFGNNDVIHLRTKSRNRYSRAVELYKEEPLLWADQDMIDYIGTNLAITVGVISNFNLSMFLQLHNIWGMPIKKGTWKIFFNSLHGIRLEDLDCGLTVGHVIGDLYYFAPTKIFSDLMPGSQRNCTWHPNMWHASESDFFPNWYVSSEGMTPRLLANTSDVSLFVMPLNSPEMWKRSSDDQYDPYTNRDRFLMNRVRGSYGRSIYVPIPYNVSGTQDGQNIELRSWKGWVIVETEEFRKEAQFLADKLSLSFAIGHRPMERFIMFNKTALPENNDEAYHLKISSESIIITVQEKAGAFYAVESLISLWETGGGEVPTLTTTDMPRFEYRGLMVDTARNFIPKEWLVKLLDVMGMYKLNKLHLRLSDNEGWRLEIPGLPELTQIGSNRCHYDEKFVCLKPHRGSGPDQSSAGSGYYSVQDYKEILQYAADRHISVIPEIAMPGNSRAAVASMVYREYKKHKLNGQGWDTSTITSYLLSDAMPKYVENIEKLSVDTLNPCLESTFDFIEKVVDEIIAMYSGIMELKTFHFGGDMVMDGTWVDTPACQNMAGSKSTATLKQEFDQRILTLLSNKGVEASFREGAFYTTSGPTTVTDSSIRNVYTWNNMWEGDNAKRTAEYADNNYKVILAMETHLDLATPYEPDPVEPGVYGATRFIDTKKIFSFMPEDLFANADVNRMGKAINMSEFCKNDACPKASKPENIKGLQGSLFSDLITTEEQFHHALFPRLLALAERAWRRSSWEELADKDKRDEARKDDWLKFTNTLGNIELPRLDKYDIDYRVPPPGVVAYEEKFRATIIYRNHDIQMRSDGNTTWVTLKEGTNTFNSGDNTVYFRTLSPEKKRPSRVITYMRTDGTTSKSPSVRSCTLALLICLVYLFAIA